MKAPSKLIGKAARDAGYEAIGEGEAAKESTVEAGEFIGKQEKLGRELS